MACRHAVLWLGVQTVGDMGEKSGAAGFARGHGGYFGVTSEVTTSKVHSLLCCCPQGKRS